MIAPRADMLVWIDLEMTGLDPAADHILEAAMIITDTTLEVQDAGISLVIHVDGYDYRSMDPWCIDHHTRSGLYGESQRSHISLQQAQELLVQYMLRWALPKTSPLCGNSVHQDKAFLRRLMPEFHALLHYRIIDVSSIKELVRRWYPQYTPFVKDETHRALQDIRASIDELRYYRGHFFKE